MPQSSLVNHLSKNVFIKLYTNSFVVVHHLISSSFWIVYRLKMFTMLLAFHFQHHKLGLMYMTWFCTLLKIMWFLFMHCHKLYLMWMIQGLMLRSLNTIWLSFFLNHMVSYDLLVVLQLTSYFWIVIRYPLHVNDTEGHQVPVGCESWYAFSLTRSVSRGTLHMTLARSTLNPLCWTSPMAWLTSASLYCLYLCLGQCWNEHQNSFVYRSHLLTDHTSTDTMYTVHHKTDNINGFFVDCFCYQY